MENKEVSLDYVFSDEIIERLGKVFVHLDLHDKHNISFAEYLHLHSRDRLHLLTP